MNTPITPQFEEKVREAMTSFTEEIHAAPDALDNIKAATRASHNRRIIGGATLAIAAAILVAVGAVAALDSAPARTKVAITHQPNKHPVPPISAPRHSTPSTLARPAPTTVPRVTPTTAPHPANPVATDPLPAGTEMLSIAHGSGPIVALDSRLNQLKTLVQSVASGRVNDAQLMPDHRTLYYIVTPAGGRCGQVFVVDLVTGAAKPVATADSFRVSPDARLLALTNRCRTGVSTTDPLVVTDLKTGKESVLNDGNHGYLVCGFSPTGDRVVLLDENSFVSSVVAVPQKLGGSLAAGTKLDGYVVGGCGSDLYAVKAGATPSNGSTYSAGFTIKRYDWHDLSKATTVATVAKGGGDYSYWVLPTPTGMLVAGGAGGGTTDLFRLAGGTLARVGVTNLPLPVPAFDPAWRAA